MHKWLINENVKFEYSCTQATFSWFENVFKPLIYAMENSLVYKAFPNHSKLGMFNEISYLHYMKTAGKQYVPYEVVCKEYILEKSKKRFIKFITKRFY